MPFTVEFDESGFIHAVYEGDLTMAGLQALMSAAADVIQEHECFLILSDYRQARMAATIADIYELPKLILQRAKERGMSAHRVKRALIIPAAAYEQFRFFETVSLNNAQTVRLFTDEDEAREWLLAS